MDSNKPLETAAAPVTDDVEALQNYMGTTGSRYHDLQRWRLSEQALERWALLRRLRDNTGQTGGST